MVFYDLIFFILFSKLQLLPVWKTTLKMTNIVAMGNVFSDTYFVDYPNETTQYFI